MPRSPSPHPAGTAPGLTERDCCYVLGNQGFVYAGRQLASGPTVRHSGVLLLSADYAPVQLSVRGGPTVSAPAMVVPPLVTRTLDARGVPLLSFNVMPSHEAFHVFGAMQQPGVVRLDRHAFNQFDDRLLALHHGELAFAQAETFFEEVVGEAVRQLPAAPAPHPKALELIRILDDNPKLSLDDLARRLGRSSQAISRMFSSAVGLSLRDYQSWLKQRRVYDLLYNTQRSLTDVAYAAGFSDSPQFSRAYQRLYGKSPSFSRDPKFVRVFIRGGENSPRQAHGSPRE
ncbi:MAG: helix-turn-helix transcriptional regulator [Cytophagales bacterium]|nr:helix-turn-helix transcriptional regulator [Rhizobacter sp.]